MTKDAKSWKDTIATINKKFGKDSVKTANTITQTSFRPTGSLALDIALGCGGYPTGRIIEIAGDEYSGKTTAVLVYIGILQKMGFKVGYLELEPLDRDWVIKCGVNLDELYIIQPNSAEQAMDLSKAVIESGHIQTLVLDSVPGLVPKSRQEKDAGAGEYGKIASLMSEQLPVMSDLCVINACDLFLINQMRALVGANPFGPQQHSYGGKALRFWASIRIVITKAKGSKVTEGDDLVGSKIQFNVIKNKVGPPFKTAQAIILHEEGGFDRGFDLAELGIQLNLIDSKTRSYGDIRLGGNKGEMYKRLREYSPLSIEIENKIREKLRLPYISYE